MRKTMTNFAVPRKANASAAAKASNAFPHFDENALSVDGIFAMYL